VPQVLAQPVGADVCIRFSYDVSGQASPVSLLQVVTEGSEHAT
jgi:hypothetical protein